MKHLVIAEHHHQQLALASAIAVGAASRMGGGDIDILVCGDKVAEIAKAASQLEGIATVLCAEAPHYAHSLPEEYAPLVASIAAGYSHIWATATTFGKDLMPRIAALLDVGQISAVSAVEGGDTFVRAIYAGSIMERVCSDAAIKVITVASTAFAPVGNQRKETATIQNINPVVAVKLSRFVAEHLTQSKRPELGSAKIVVSGGRGLGSAEKFALIEALADSLGAAVGASRAAVDAGYIGNDYQVGQTGKSVAPDLYIAVGISGAIQHLAGMQDSKIIVAINKDSEAPIMAVCDYAVVGDLFNIVPELIEALKK